MRRCRLPGGNWILPAPATRVRTRRRMETDKTNGASDSYSYWSGHQSSRENRLRPSGACAGAVVSFRSCWVRCFGQLLARLLCWLFPRYDYDALMPGRTMADCAFCLATKIRRPRLSPKKKKNRRPDLLISDLHHRISLSGSCPHTRLLEMEGRLRIASRVSVFLVSLFRRVF